MGVPFGHCGQPFTMKTVALNNTGALVCWCEECI